MEIGVRYYLATEFKFKFTILVFKRYEKTVRILCIYLLCTLQLPLPSREIKNCFGARYAFPTKSRLKFM